MSRYLHCRCTLAITAPPTRPLTFVAAPMQFMAAEAIVRDALPRAEVERLHQAVIQRSVALFASFASTALPISTQDQRPLSQLSVFRADRRAFGLLLDYAVRLHSWSLSDVGSGMHESARSRGLPRTKSETCG